MKHSELPESIDLALAKYPYSFIEKIGIRGNFLLTFALISAYTALYHLLDIQPTVLMRIASVGAGIGSQALDLFTTYRSFQASEAYTSLGKEPPVEERNPFLSKTKSARELITNPLTYALNIPIITMNLILPETGFPMAAQRILVAMSNNKLTERVRLATKIERQASQID